MPRGNWIATYSGLHVHPLDFRPEMVSIEDIAHSLSMICRFTGHTREFYSVAEHCVLLANLVEERWSEPKKTLHMLLHDCAEAYLNDLSNPLKLCEEFAFYKKVETSIEQVVWQHFGLPLRFDPELKALDAAILLAEGQFFFPNDVNSWVYPPKETTERVEFRFKCWDPNVAKRRFLGCFWKASTEMRGGA